MVQADEVIGGKSLRHWAMTGLGLGYGPVAPGTWGSGGAVVIAGGAWVVASRAGLPPLVLDVTWVVLAGLAFAGCVQWGPWAVTYFAGRARKPGDPGAVVLDEFAGQWLALVGIAMPNARRALAMFALQFILFRLFDVLKPPPARRMERLPAGWGIASDDVVAGIYANVVGQLLSRLVF